MKPAEPWLDLNGTRFSLDQLKARDFTNDLNTFEQHTLHFCHRWLNGQQTFQLNTSGSTGTPKSITITRGQMEASARLTIKALQLEPGYTALVCLDTQFIGGQMMLVRSLLLGMNVVAVDPSSNPFGKIPGAQPIDFAALVPLQLHAILNSASRSELDDLKCVIIGGAPLDMGTKRELQSLRCRCYATYGMTETISHVALQLLNGEQSQDYFEAFKEIAIDRDERGCLTIRTDFLDEKGIVTNDLVDVIDSHKFRWLGRWDNIINSGGVKVIPEKIETAVQEIFDSMKLANRFFVAGLPDEKLNQRVSLIIEGAPLEKDLLLNLESQLGERVERYEKPRDIKFIHNFRQTDTGKVLRTETMHLIPASSH